MVDGNKTPEGWYKDPNSDHLMRYWSGTAWTEHVFDSVTKERSQQPLQRNVPQAKKEEGLPPLSRPAPKVLSSAGQASTTRPLRPSAPEAFDPPKITFFSGKKIALELVDIIRGLEGERNVLLEEIHELNALSSSEVESIFTEIERRRDRAEYEIAALNSQLVELREMVVETNDLAILQEAGYYEYSHVLSNSLAYKGKLDQIKASYKEMIRAKTAVTGAADWTVNGSKKEGEKMVRELSGLMLRAYNAESDGLVKALRPYKLDSAVERLNRSVAAIEKLGKTMQIRIDPHYHSLKIQELKLTADYLEKREEEKADERERREKEREERADQKAIDDELKRLKALKEREVRQKELAKAALLVKIAQEEDAAKKTEMLSSLTELVDAIEEIEEAYEDEAARAANMKAGYVYVISNIGAFGPGMVKIGMTRRVNPLDRVKELSGASVPFHFDVHLLQYSEDARGMEALLHKHFASRKVNLVNRRKEFFYASPIEVEEALTVLNLAGIVTEFVEEPLAEQFIQSQRLREKDALNVATAQPEPYRGKRSLN